MKLESGGVLVQSRNLFLSERVCAEYSEVAQLSVYFFNLFNETSFSFLVCCLKKDLSTKTRSFGQTEIILLDFRINYFCCLFRRSKLRDVVSQTSLRSQISENIVNAKSMFSQPPKFDFSDL